MATAVGGAFEEIILAFLFHVSEKNDLWLAQNLGTIAFLFSEVYNICLHSKAYPTSEQFDQRRTIQRLLCVSVSC